MNRDDKSLDAQMEHLLNQLEIEKAPASLTRRLRQIPREHPEHKPRLPWLFPGPLPKWAMAPTAARGSTATVVIVGWMVNMTISATTAKEACPSRYGSQEGQSASSMTSERTRLTASPGGMGSGSAPGRRSTLAIMFLRSSAQP